MCVSRTLECSVHPLSAMTALGGLRVEGQSWQHGLKMPHMSGFLGPRWGCLEPSPTSFSVCCSSDSSLCSRKPQEVHSSI